MEQQMINILINGKEYTVPKGITVLEAARMANIDIPTLCYLKDINEIGACRICMVEVEGEQRLPAVSGGSQGCKGLSDRLRLSHRPGRHRNHHRLSENP